MDSKAQDKILEGESQVADHHEEPMQENRPDDPQIGKVIRCACVSMDAYECARIRDRRSSGFDDEDDDFHRRACECDCHEDYDDWDDE